MINDLGLKLIAVLNSEKLITFEAQGLKIINELETFAYPIDKSHRHEKSQSLYKLKSAPGSLFEPHSDAKDLEHQEAARAIIGSLEKQLEGKRAIYKELIIVAEPKMLGYIRKYSSDSLKKIITKEVIKDLVHHNKSDIELAVFS
jgi:protein required for attachment to host cells